MKDKKLTVREAAKQSGLTESTIRAYITSGGLQSVKEGSRRLIWSSALDEFMDGRAERRPPVCGGHTAGSKTPQRIIDERDVEKRLTDACKRRGWICWKFTSPGKNGVPDRIVIRPRGYAAPAFVDFVEVKSPTGRLRPSQRKLHMKMREVGAQVVVVHNFREVDEAVKRWEKECADRGDCWVASLS